MACAMVPLIMTTHEKACSIQKASLTDGVDDNDGSYEACIDSNGNDDGVIH